MNDFTRFDARNRVDQRREQGTVVLHPVPFDVNYNDAERQLLQIVLVLEAAVDGDQNVALTMSLSKQLGVGQRPPFGFRHGNNLMTGECLPQPGVNALV